VRGGGGPAWRRSLGRGWWGACWRCWHQTRRAAPGTSSRPSPPVRDRVPPPLPSPLSNAFATIKGIGRISDRIRMVGVSLAHATSFLLISYRTFNL